MSNPVSQMESQCSEEIFQRVAGDLSMIADRELEVLGVETEVLDHRAAGEGQIHISFRLGFQSGGQQGHGCLLIPLPEAITLACSLMMVSDEVIEQSRGLDSLDEPTKDAMLEVGNFIGGATEAAFRALELPCKVAFEGCQGVRADVRPALLYNEGDPLLTSQAHVQLAGYGDSRYVLLIPRQVCAA